MNAFVLNPTSYAEASRALKALLEKAEEAAAEAAAAEAAQEAAAADKAALIEGAKKKPSMAARLKRQLTTTVFGASTNSGIHPWRECPICLELLGTEGNGVQALGCMDAFCRVCIATHLDCQASAGAEMSCPICKRVVPAEERNECGDAKELPDKHEAGSAAPAASASGSTRGGVSSPVDAAVPRQAHASAAPGRTIGQRLATAAVTAAAVVTHAPQLLRSSPEHLAAAAHALAGSGRRGDGAGGGGDDDDDDGDMVFLDDGEVISLGGHLDQVRR